MFVTVMSYVALFLLGGLASLTLFYVWVEQSTKREERKMRENVERLNSLTALLEQYKTPDPRLN